MAQAGFAEETFQPNLAAEQDAARHKLALALRERAAASIVPITRPDARAVTMSDRRAVVVAQAESLVDAFDLYVRREVRASIDRGRLVPDAVDVDDVVSTAYLRALEQADQAPITGGIYPWLRRLANATVDDYITATSERAALEESLEAAAERGQILGDDGWRQSHVPLIDTLPGAAAQEPEAIVVGPTAGYSLAQVIARLPERWREVFMLKLVDGWADADIAAVEGIPVSEVPILVERTRERLRQWLHGVND